LTHGCGRKPGLFPGLLMQEGSQGAGGCSLGGNGGKAGQISHASGTACQGERLRHGGGRAGGGAGEGKPERCRNGKAGVVLPGAARWRAKK